MSIQAVTASQFESTPKLAYEFLSYPPPQKKRPTQPLPPCPTTPTSPVLRRRSHTISAIAAWVAHVQPGSPAPASPPYSTSPPCSARRPSLYSLSRRSSLTRSRRPSVTSVRVPSASFLVLDTPHCAVTPSFKDYQPDLLSLGYTYAFVPLPTPAMTSEHLDSHMQAQKKLPGRLIIPTFPISPVKTSPKRGTLRRLRALSVLKPRTLRHSKSLSSPNSPARSPSGKKVKAKGKVGPARRRSRSSASMTALAIARRKKAKYAFEYLAAPLQNEIALMQFADGGNAEENIRRVMEHEARRAAKHGRTGAEPAVADVHRDGRGGVWWDEHEEWEYAHLLGGETSFDMATEDEHAWVGFDTAAKVTSTNTAESEERRGSISSQDSDLDPRYALPAPGVESSTDDLAAFGSALTPVASCIPGLSVLSIPARSRRTAPHLRKAAFIRDAYAFVPPRSPRSPVAPARAVPKGKARRRPAPLTLLAPAPQMKCPTNSPVEQPSAPFFSDSFVPAPAPALSQLAVVAEVSRTGRGINKKPSRLNLAVGGGVKGFFKAMTGRKE